MYLLSLEKVYSMCLQSSQSCLIRSVDKAFEIVKLLKSRMVIGNVNVEIYGCMYM